MFNFTPLWPTTAIHQLPRDSCVKAQNECLHINNKLIYILGCYVKYILILGWITPLNRIGVFSHLKKITFKTTHFKLTCPHLKLNHPALWINHKDGHFLPQCSHIHNPHSSGCSPFISILSSLSISDSTHALGFSTLAWNPVDTFPHESYQSHFLWFNYPVSWGYPFSFAQNLRWCVYNGIPLKITHLTFLPSY